ncbi:MAG: serine hydrolase [Alphaproteobacteria bacterium]|nr:serine hydrolase [Alphaproteobacteria bacterium]
MAPGVVSRFLRYTIFALAFANGGCGLNKALALDALPLAADASSVRPGLDEATIARVVRRAGELPRLHSLIVARHGTIHLERRFRGPRLDVSVNVKSVAKVVISALVGLAIDRGLIEGPQQPIVSLLGESVADAADPRLQEVTIGHLLSMQSGLERTSGANYGRWVNSKDWVGYALSRPFVDEPGGRMLYSTGNSHILSAVLTRVSGRSTLDLARAWLAAPLGFDLPPWDRDPQGIYLGGNNMLLSPRALLRFGEMYRNGGIFRGKRVLSEAWVRASWTPHTESFFSGDGYGYGWFIAKACGHPVHYARGYGGQFLYVVPSLSLTIVITSQTTTRTRVDDYYTALRSDVVGELVAAAVRTDTAASGVAERQNKEGGGGTDGSVAATGCGL